MLRDMLHPALEQQATAAEHSAGGQTHVNARDVLKESCAADAGRSLNVAKLAFGDTASSEARCKHMYHASGVPASIPRNRPTPNPDVINPANTSGSQDEPLEDEMQIPRDTYHVPVPICTGHHLKILAVQAISHGFGNEANWLSTCGVPSETLRYGALGACCVPVARYIEELISNTEANN
ncbi:hypothetical protein MYCTH_2122612 [Thermothelomyces thermophilus ATCC 42464]|uniref:Uncharacterized protein n=1 Tax=Thermothelomyces thermophilus (strain ATCC 42464 / BCRC 31852 / DSM 1799) TaxID=573729 RepID=G2Q505_THET4|nr:uncharacterized protein MYCTH_2122612 [Thermothelomyces thermophilus ATCC 42464]AEO53742.1 hypothetical protein MYCTH_2122612 [Thermothelomyces thermophilus ATCC 42464]